MLRASCSSNNLFRFAFVCGNSQGIVILGVDDADGVLLSGLVWGTT